MSGVVVDDRPLLSDEAYRVLRDAVLDGTLEPGERLHDDELITWLGVSRTPIRSALDRLRAAGLVEFSANRYTRVRAPDAAWLREAASVVVCLHRAAALDVVPRLDDRSVAAVCSGLATARRLLLRLSGRPLPIEVLRCLGVALGGVAARSASEVVAASLDEAELRLAHALLASGCVVELQMWDDFTAAAERALAERDAGLWADSLAELVRRVVEARA
jgi:hypothetical protein